MEKHLKLARYLKGTADALRLLAAEIKERGVFDKDDEDLVSKIGSNLLFHAKTYSFLSPSEEISATKTNK